MWRARAHARTHARTHAHTHSHARTHARTHAHRRRVREREREAFVNEDYFMFYSLVNLELHMFPSIKNSSMTQQNYEVFIDVTLQSHTISFLSESLPATRPTDRTTCPSHFIINNQRGTPKFVEDKGYEGTGS